MVAPTRVEFREDNILMRFLCVKSVCSFFFYTSVVGPGYCLLARWYDFLMPLLLSTYFLLFFFFFTKREKYCRWVLCFPLLSCASKASSSSDRAVASFLTATDKKTDRRQSCPRTLYNDICDLESIQNMLYYLAELPNLSSRYGNR